MTATSEPGRASDWDDTGPIPLPAARPANDSPETAQDAPAATSDATKPARPVFDRADNTARLALEVAALASVGRTEPAPEACRSGHIGCDFDATPAPFTRYSGTAGSKVDAAQGGGEEP